MRHPDKDVWQADRNTEQGMSEIETVKLGIIKKHSLWRKPRD